MGEEDKINFEKLMEESKELCNMIAKNDILGQRINEIFKVLTNAMYVQNEKIKELDQTATDYKNKYESLLAEHKDLQHDYDVIYDLYERKKQLLQAIEDNEED